MAEETNQPVPSEAEATPSETVAESTQAEATETEAQPAAKKSAAKPKDGEVPAKAVAAKKEKPPALEDKPFGEFVEQYYIPAIQKVLAAQGIEDAKLALEKQKIPVVGFDSSPECWQISGSLNQDSRKFNLYFLDESIQGKKAFSYTTGKSQPSTIESFLIDERKMTLDLLVWGIIQRLNAQKWLARN
ncbi:DUF2996 domain-containing protein [Merismopedia glauca]|uniref:DUF2996 domain-containing protein n=1 Tax=Merismopedia glauca TaxID=292586 RepID=UPI001C631E3B|nr:DUF2996 domain-containing protein [Merismopedia glauca]